MAAGHAAVRRDLVIGAVIIAAVLIALHYMQSVRQIIPGANIDLMGDISLPSGNGPVDVGAAIETELQSATSPDGKYEVSIGSFAYAVPPASF